MGREEIIVVAVFGLNTLLACALAGGLAWAFAQQPDDLEQQRALYCEMVETFKNTGGEYGWPDYHGAYGRDCQ